MCPAAPFLVGGTADALAGRVPELVAACGTAVRALLDVDAIVLLSTRSRGRPNDSAATHSSPAVSRTVASGTVLGAAGFARSDCAPQRTFRLPAGNAGHDSPAQPPDRAVGTVVGAALLAAAAATVPVTAVEIAGRGSDRAAALTALTAGPDRIGVLVMADGAACHGDAAPGRRSDAADPFDRAVADALAAGDPAALRSACSDQRSATELLATVEPLAALAALVAGRPPSRSRLLYSAAPFGVGYLVGLWLWS